MKYQDYLNSAHWKNLRSKKYSKKKRSCAICGSSERLEVHHLIYKNLTDVETSDLRVLCHRCHFLAHDLMKAGKIVFKSEGDNSRFATIKYYVKKKLGISRVNMFNKDKKVQDRLL